MSKKTLLLFVLSLAFIVSALSPNLSAQTAVTGDWTASLVDKGDKINLNFGLRDEKAERTNKHQFGQTYDFAELGLSREQVVNGGPVKFSLAREAGNIDCEGTLQNSKGAGTFRFTPNQAFVSGMKSRGFDFEKYSVADKHPRENKLFAAAALNVTTALADDLASAGFKLDMDDLFKSGDLQDRLELHARDGGHRISKPWHGRFG